MNKKLIIVVTLSLILSACTSKQANDETVVDNDMIEYQGKDSPYDINYDDVIDEDINKKIVITETEHTLNDVNLKRYMYTDEKNTNYPAGMPLVVKKGNALNLDIVNNTNVKTNIHWHGLSLPNDQDGPQILMDENGGEHRYSFTPDYTGTYWYHSHNRPVRDQVDFGMHAPLIVLNENDAQYTFDRVLMLDDWLVNRNGGHMQVEGDVDTVNGVSGDDIEPIMITNNDLVKLRFIQASTAKNTTLYFPFPVKVTHMDGIALEEPYETNELELSPAERYDVEFRITKQESDSYIIRNERNNGMVIPIEYTYLEDVVQFNSTPAKPEKEDQLLSKKGDDPDIFVNMDSRMSHGKGYEWTINGEVFPDTEKFELDLDKEYLIRFNNFSNSFNHPMHIHGAHFKVISINGEEPPLKMWKDTIDVLPNEYIDIAIRFENPGEWMLHCHILDHEDGGMMTTIIVK